MNSDDVIEKKKKIVLKMAKIFDKVCVENNIDYSLTAGSVLGAVRHKGFIPWDYDMDVVVPVDQFELMRTKLKEAINDKGYVLHEWDKEKKYYEVVDRLCPANVPHQEVHLDIFPLIGAPNKRKKQVRFAKKCFYTFRILRCKNCDTNYSKKNHVKKIKMIKFFVWPIPDKAIIAWYHHLQNKYKLSDVNFTHRLASGYGLAEIQNKEVFLDTKRVPFEDTKLSIPKKAVDYLIKIYGDDYMTPKRDGYKIMDKK